MKIRHRLTLAFFSLSVLPLAIVTGYSYYSSAAALRRAAESQANQMAADMGQRMAWVLADLGERVERAWHLQPRPEASGASGRMAASAAAPPATEPQGGASEAETRRLVTELQARVHVALAEAAPLVERLEFLSVPDGSGAATSPPGRVTSGPPPPAAPATPRRPTAKPPAPHPPRVVVDMKVPGLPARSRTGGGIVAFDLPSREDMDAWRLTIQQQEELERQAGQVTADLLREARTAAQAAVQAGEAGRPAANDRRRLNARRQLKALTSGEEVTFPVLLDGAVVGEVNAKVNRHRMIETVLGLARRDRGDVPFVLDSDNDIHTTGPDDAVAIERLGLDRQALAALPGQSSRTIGDWVVVTRPDESGMVFGIASPLADPLRDMRMAAARSLGLGALLIVGLFSVIAPLAARMTRHITALTDGVQRLARGDRETRVTLGSRDEIGELAAAFNRMAGELEAHEKSLVQQERLRRELELCRQIQVDMLPHGPLRLGLTEISGVSIPAREVGGDFFNYFALGDGSVALLVGDVSGKGVGAALLMANIQATLRARLPLELDLPALVDSVDRDVAANTPPEVYLTLFIGILDPQLRTLRYVNAGHNTQFVVHAGSLSQLDSTGLPVGLLPGRGYEERTVAVNEGDLLFLYTDGAVEVEDEAGDMFGAERLQQALTAAAASDVADVLTRVETAIRGFRGSAEPSDDATMMAVRVGRRQG